MVDHSTPQQSSKTSQSNGKLSIESSPRNPQSNGMAERCVQTMKTSLIKTMEEGEDMDLALFDIQDYTSESQTTIASRVAEL